MVEKVTVKMPERIYMAIVARAEKEYRSVSDQVVYILQTDLERSGELEARRLLSASAPAAQGVV